MRKFICTLFLFFTIVNPIAKTYFSMEVDIAGVKKGEVGWVLNGQGVSADFNDELVYYYSDVDLSDALNKSGFVNVGETM